MDTTFYTSNWNRTYIFGSIHVGFFPVYLGVNPDIYRFPTVHMAKTHFHCKTSIRNLWNLHKCQIYLMFLQGGMDRMSYWHEGCKVPREFKSWPVVHMYTCLENTGKSIGQQVLLRTNDWFHNDLCVLWKHCHLIEKIKKFQSISPTTMWLMEKLFRQNRFNLGYSILVREEFSQ